MKPVSPVSFLVLLAVIITVQGSIMYQSPKVLIVTLIRNKEHTLPYFFSYLEDQEYPKDRISLW